MKDFCKKCGLCCKLIPSCSNKILRDGFQPIEEFFTPISFETALNINEEYVKNVQKIFPDVEFYTCKYLSQENICTNQTMPESCRIFPNSPLAIISEDCGFSGEIFLKKESLKQKIRKLKEEILNYETLIISNPKEKNSYQRIINSHNNFIKKYEQFGSLNW